MIALEAFVIKNDLFNKDVAVITRGYLEELKMQGYSPEDLLNYLARQQKCLLHGSTGYIRDNFLKPKNNNKLFATDNASVAILKAIIDKTTMPFGSEIMYPLRITERHPMEVRIKGLRHNTIKEKGLVYLIKDVSEFRNDPVGSCQYISKSCVPFVAIIEVNRADFKYPVFDSNKGIKLPEI